MVSMRILICRLGAIGDMIGITPLLRYLKNQNNELYVLTKKTGEDILRYNPNVAKLVLYNDELKKMFPELDDVPNDKFSEFIDAVAKAYECEKTINLCECWEVKLARHPAEPSFKYPKQWAKEHCDTNYYEQVFGIAGVSTMPEFGAETGQGRNIIEKADTDTIQELFRPEMFFDNDEEIQMNNWFVDFRKIAKKVIMWGLSGSAANKTYPYVPEVIFPILERHKDICFLTVGDEMCQVLEQELKHERIINRSGVWSLRQSCLATKHADLVIAPDTGILHAAGCWEVPKIGLLNHTSLNNIVKHFKNDYSLHAQDGKHPFFGPISCCSCYQLHYKKKVTCNVADVKGTQAPICMVWGIPPDRVIARIEEVLHEAHTRAL